MKEVWKDIPILENYQASSLGNVRRLESSYLTTYKGKIVKRYLPSKEFHTDKLNPKGYKRINILGRVYFVHQLVAMVFLGHELGTEKQINHIDGDKINNRVSNLEIVTPRENIKHAIKNGLIDTKGDFSPKLTQAIAEEIRRDKDSGMSNRQLSKKYKVSDTTIWKVCSYRTYSKG